MHGMPQIEQSTNTSENRQSNPANISAGQSKEHVVRIACPPARRHHGLPLDQEMRGGERCFPGSCQVYPKARTGTAPRLVPAASASSKAYLSLVILIRPASIQFVTQRATHG